MYACLCRRPRRWAVSSWRRDLKMKKRVNVAKGVKTWRRYSTVISDEVSFGEEVTP